MELSNVRRLIAGTADREGLSSMSEPQPLK
jgi:hypothetical protein